MSRDPTGNLMLWMAIMSIVGIVLFISGFFKLKRKKLIESTPTSKIRSLSMGLVEIYGEVIPITKNILISPFSKKNCVYYKYKIEELRRSGKHSKWVTVKFEEKQNLFYFKDETGIVLVDPAQAKVDIDTNFFVNSGMGKEPPENIKEFLRANNIGFKGFLGINKAMRFSEKYIEPGEKLYIMGAAVDNPYVSEGTLTGTADVMIGKSEYEKILLISDKQEKNIIKSLNKSINLYIYGGAFLSIICLTIFLYLLKQII